MKHSTHHLAEELAAAHRWAGLVGHKRGAGLVVPCNTFAGRGGLAGGDAAVDRDAGAADTAADGVAEAGGTAAGAAVVSAVVSAAVSGGPVAFC